MQQPMDDPRRQVRRDARRLLLGLGLAVCGIFLWELEKLGERAVAFLQPYDVGNGLQIELDERVLYRAVPGPAGINSWGYRGPEPALSGRLPRVLVLGDSFVMGLNVPAEQTFSAAKEKRLQGRFEVLNLGVFGYGPDQSLLRLLQDGPGLRPDALVLSLFPANDFNDLTKNRIFRLDTSGRLVGSPENPVTEALSDHRWTSRAWKVLTGRPVARHAGLRLFQLLWDDTHDPLPAGDPESRRKVALMRAVLAKIQQVAGAAGLPLTVLIIPAQRREQRGNEKVAEDLCAQLRLPFVSLVPAFSPERRDLYDPRDGHLSREGNQLAAAYLAEAVLRQGARPQEGLNRFPLANVFR